MKQFKQIVFFSLISCFLLACNQGNNIVAWVDEKEISQTSVDSYLIFKQINDGNANQADQLVEQYIDSEAVTLAIEKTDLYRESNLATEINELKKTWLLERYLKQYLAENVNDEAIQNFHASDENKFKTQKARVAHILIRTDKNMDNSTREAKYNKALEAYNKLKSGSGFSQIVREYSDDSLTIDKAGDLGWVEPGVVNKQFSELVFKRLQTNDFSKPFQSRFGFHILKLLDAPKMVKEPLPKVKKKIRQTLKQKLKFDEIKRLMASVKITRT